MPQAEEIAESLANATRESLQEDLAYADRYVFATHPLLKPSPDRLEDWKAYRRQILAEIARRG